LLHRQMRDMRWMLHARPAWIVHARVHLHALGGLTPGKGKLTGPEGAGSRPDERKRIEINGGVVGLLDLNADPPRVVSIEEERKTGNGYGPVRVFFQDGEWESPHGIRCRSAPNKPLPMKYTNKPLPMKYTM
jgi:hypothetical protein